MEVKVLQKVGHSSLGREVYNDGKGPQLLLLKTNMVFIAMLKGHMPDTLLTWEHMLPLHQFVKLVVPCAKPKVIPNDGTTGLTIIRQYA